MKRAFRTSLVGGWVEVLVACTQGTPAPAGAGRELVQTTAAPSVAATPATCPAFDSGAVVEARVGAINAAGLVIGSVVDTAGRPRAVVWHLGPPDTLELLPTPAGYARADAFAVNARGEVAGTVGRGLTYGGADSRAVRWTAGGVTLAPLAPGYTGSSGIAINAAGAIAGVLVDDARPGHPFVWRGGDPGALEVLDLGGPGDGDATALSDAGDPAGTVAPKIGPGAGYNQAVVWRGGHPQHLFARADGSNSSVTGGSPSGVVVGEVGTAVRSEGTLAFAWTPGPGAGTMDTSLRTGDAGRVRYTAVNDRGTLVGDHDGIDPFVRVRGRMQPLTLPPGWTRAKPAGVNDAGLIVGTAELPAPAPLRTLPRASGRQAWRVPTRAVLWDTAGRVRVLSLGPARCRAAPAAGR